MSDSPHDKGPLLGQQVAGSETYDPGLLFPVPRENARSRLAEPRVIASGEDVWHAYELSWLSATGMPQICMGTLRIPSTSPNLVESKSLKLYLNSLNNHRFESNDGAKSVIIGDVAKVVGSPVELSLHRVDSAEFSGEALPGACLDDREVSVPASPDDARLVAQAGDATWYTHLMRSRCPVTNQPDWATVVVESRGCSPTPDSLLAHLLSFRNHQEFHEQCVERIYAELWTATAPEYLSVHALYTRRGGLDICPWRCSEARPAPLYRLNRQ